MQPSFSLLLILLSHRCSTFAQTTGSTEDNSRLQLQVECGKNEIKVSLNKSLLTKLGFKNIIMHLNDDSCAGFEEQRNVRLVSVVTPIHDGQCGTQLMRNKTHSTFSNMLYLANGPVVQGKEIKINFHCSYPLNMETTLKTAIYPMVSSYDFTLGGYGSFTVQMGFYKDSKCTSVYERPRVKLPYHARLYVGIRVTRGDMSLFVLQIEKCYATPRRDTSIPLKYTLIKYGCPTFGEAIIKVLENGVSEQGRFSLELYYLFIRHRKGYLHCKFFLCKKDIHKCKPDCSKMGSIPIPVDPLSFTFDFTLHLGPVVRSDSMSIWAATSHGFQGAWMTLLIPAVLGFSLHAFP